MNKPVTILDPRARRPPSSSLSAALPPDLYEQVRRRVRLLAVLTAAGFALGPVVFFVILAASKFMGELPDDFWDSAEFLWLQGSAILVSAVLWWRARNPKASPDGLLTLGIIYQVAMCLTIGVLTYWSGFRESGDLPRLTWIPAVVILFPLIMPGPPRRMLWGAIAAGAMAPVSLALLQGLGLIAGAADIYLSSILNSGLAVVFAYVGARTVYGLGKQVAEARQLGSYQLEEQLGTGGMGEVWRARHRMLARPAAVKLIRPDQAGSEVALGRFEQEAQATAGLRSPHTIEVYDFGIADDGTFYYVMELLDGLDAASLVERFGPLPAERAVYLLRQACRSLSEAHAHDLIHRDIKPANIFVCRYGEEFDFVKVLDFGLVKNSGNGSKPDVHLTGDMVSGTPSFMAPEQALGNRNLDGRADLYGLGCVAYWLLTGEPVFAGETAMEVITKHISTPPVPVSERTEMSVPDSLERVIMACLEKDPDRRPGSARELLEMLVDDNGWNQGRARTWWEMHVPG